MRAVFALVFLCFMTIPAIAETGIASVYSTSDKDQPGTKTASGIPLNDRKPTIAHRTLPLGSFAVVANLTNGKSLSFRVTDRGPFVSGRIVDLSVAAAVLLGCRGLCRVAVQPQ